MKHCKKHINYSIFILLIFLLCSSSKAYTQSTQIDSLEKWVTKYPKRDTVWVKNLILLEKLYYTQKPEKIGIYAHTIVEQSKKQNYLLGIEKGLASLAYQYIQKGKYEDALKTIFEKLVYDEKANNIYEKVNSYSILGYIYGLTGKNKEKAIENFLKGKEFALSLPTDNPKRIGALVAIYSNLNIGYIGLKRYDDALKVLFEALSILKTQTNIKDINYYYQLSAILLNIGLNYTSINKYNESSSYLKKGINIALKNNIKIGLPRYYAALSKNYIQLKQFDIAYQELLPLKKMYENKALSTEEVAIYLDYLEQIEEGKHQYQEAYYTLKKSVLHEDSIKGVQQQAQIQELTVKYKTEQKEQQNKLLQAQNDKANARNQVFLITIVAALILLLASLFFYLKLRSKNNKLDNLNHIKDRLFAIIAHDLKRPVNTFQNLLPVIKFVLDKKQYHRLNDVFSQAQLIGVDMNLVLDNLFRWSLSQQNKIVIKQENTLIAPIIADVEAEFEPIAEVKNIRFETSCPPQTHILIDKTILSSILRNLLSNAFKFTSDGGSVSISVNTENTNTHISIKDTGIGIPANILGKLFSLDSSKRRDGTAGEPGSGLGLLLTKELVELQNGTIRVKTQEGKGSEFSIIFVH